MKWRAWAIAIFSLAVISAIVLVAVFRHDDYPHDVGSSDVKACDLVEHSAVASAAGATEFKNPAPPKVGTVDFQNPGDDFTSHVDVHNSDQCIYYLDATSQQGGIPYLKVTVLPHKSASIGPLLAAGTSHAVKDGISYAPLPGVGSQAVLGTGGSDTLLSYVVAVRSGSWDVKVEGRLPERRVIAVAHVLADAPRLKQPPR